MARQFCWVLLVALPLLSQTTATENEKARDELKQGVEAFKNAYYSGAVEHFKRAIELDPNFLKARLYLASTYSSQYVPGIDSEENNRMAEAAVKAFQQALVYDPSNIVALKSLGFLVFSQKHFDEATKWNHRLMELNPEDKEAYYNIAVIDWTKAFQLDSEARKKTGMRPEDPGPIKDKQVREQIKKKNEAVIKDGIEMSRNALGIDPNYDDAMGYLSLLYRQQADIADTPEEAKKLTLQADEWMQKTLDLKKRKTGYIP
ncbi:MAG TPA: hypothetical protein VEU62_19365 [Bryobacterales bacterium]|nr:hypothetical protein [Bryobacterales bacterium]